jgi:hypothetical protein
MMPDMDDLQAVRCLESGDSGGLELLIARYQGKALKQPNPMLALIEVDSCQVIALQNSGGYVSSWLP